MDEEKEAKAAPAGEAGEKPAEETAETFTVTREQMEKMEGLAKELAGVNDKFLRLAAEYDNYRKRTAKEKETIYQDAKLDTVKHFLEVYDNLERAVSQSGDEENAHKKGMEMIFHQLEGVLEKLGVTVVDPMGESFDPERHEAVMHIDSDQLGGKRCQPGFPEGVPAGGESDPVCHRAGRKLNIFLCLKYFLYIGGQTHV